MGSELFKFPSKEVSIPDVKCGPVDESTIARAFAFLSISCAFAGLAGASFSPNYVDIAPKYAGLLHGLCDTFQSAGGFMVPLAVGAIIKG